MAFPQTVVLFESGFKRGLAGHTADAEICVTGFTHTCNRTHTNWIFGAVAIFMRASVCILSLHIPLCVHHMDMYITERERAVLAHPQTDTHIHALIPTHTNASLCVCARVSHVAIYVVGSEEAASELLGGGWFCTLTIEWMPGPFLWAAAIRMCTDCCG